MLMVLKLLFALILVALLAGCDRQGDAAANAPVPSAKEVLRDADQPEVLRSETVNAVFTGWDLGDYVWARLQVEGREPFGAWSGPSPIDLFLDAHIGKAITVRLETIIADVPEAGGKMELQRIADARIGSLTAQAWWQSLDAKHRQDAQISLAGALEPRPPQE
jgi:hypothetical protein